MHRNLQAALSGVVVLGLVGVVVHTTLGGGDTAVTPASDQVGITVENTLEPLTPSTTAAASTTPTPATTTAAAVPVVTTQAPATTRVVKAVPLTQPAPVVAPPVGTTGPPPAADPAPVQAPASSYPTTVDPPTTVDTWVCPPGYIYGLDFGECTPPFGRPTTTAGR